MRGCAAVAVACDWDPLLEVALARPTYYRQTVPVNKTQRAFYGSRSGPTQAAVVAEHDAVRELLAREVRTIIDIPTTARHPLQFNARDAAVVVDDALYVARMRHSLRAGEPELVRSCIEPSATVRTLEKGFLEGGDVLVAPDFVCVGIGERSTAEGFEALCSQLSGRFGVPIFLRDGILHLDVALTLIGCGTGLVYRPALRDGVPAVLREFDLVEVTPDEFEEHGTNVLCLGANRVVLDRRHRRIVGQLERRGLTCLEVNLTEISKVGGGIRCMTLPLVRGESVQGSTTNLQSEVRNEVNSH